MMTIQVSDTFFHDLEKEKKEVYNQALEDFSEKILNWKPKDEEYRSFKDVVDDVKEQLRK